MSSNSLPLSSPGQTSLHGPQIDTGASAADGVQGEFRGSINMLPIMRGVLARLEELSDSVACRLSKRVIDDLESNNFDRNSTDAEGSSLGPDMDDFSADFRDALSDLYWHLMDQINGLHWRDVPKATRDTFSAVSLLVCKTALSVWRGDEVVLEEMFKVCDVALLLGSDFAYRELQSLLETLDETIALRRRDTSSPPASTPFERSWRRARSTLSYLPAILQPRQRHLGQVTALPGPVSMASFRDDFMCEGLPVKFLCGSIEHWPARVPGQRAWNNIDYIHRVAGHRTIPVELGNYLSDSSSQAIMTMDDFMKTFLIDDRRGYVDPTANADTDGPPLKKAFRSTSPDVCPEAAVGYLAQHRLLHQIPLLRRDVCIPDYCSILLPEDLAGDEGRTEGVEGSAIAGNHDDGHDHDDEEEEVVVNAWLGPVGTVSPLHHDPYHNLLAQVYGEANVKCTYPESVAVKCITLYDLIGYKYVRLFAPSQSAKLYACSGRMSNNSPVDILSLDVSRHPDAVHAEFLDTVLCPGEVLYIPRHHWHFVASIDRQTAASILRSSGLPAKTDTDRLDPRCVPPAVEANSATETSGRGGVEMTHGDEDMPCWSVNFWWGRRILKDQG